MTEVFCERTECANNNEGKCSRTNILVISIPNLRVGFCGSEAKRKSPGGDAADQEPKKNITLITF